jgi:anti-sigma regulatory factor (Ser/Thr protein kinase)
MATLLYMVLAPDGRSAVFANAGHLPPLVVDAEGTPRLLDGARGVPVGVLPYASFEETGAQLTPGSTLVLYTDGLVEERGISIELRLDDLQRVASAPFEGPNELCERLLRDLLPDGPGVDDVAVLALTTAPASTDRLALTFPAQPEALITARRALRNWLAEVGVDAEALYDITLATGEACTNAIEHAYAPGAASFDLEALRRESDVLVIVRDYGSWRQPRGQHRGRGLKLMETLMDEVKVRRESNGTIVELRRELTLEADAG